MDTFWANIGASFKPKYENSEDNLGCYLWVGALRSSGYGRFWIKWPDMAYRKEELAHRVAYMLEHKLLPEELQAMSGGLELSHLCHHKKCVKPDHIILESHINNMSRLHCEKQGMCSANHWPLCLL
jgi:hypothetical protein